VRGVSALGWHAMKEPAIVEEHGQIGRPDIAARGRKRALSGQVQGSAFGMERARGRLGPDRRAVKPPLPAIRLPNPRRDDLMPEDPPYVLASFDVSPSGKARNIEIIESSPEDNVLYKRRAKRSIANTKFRPRYEDGKPVLTTGVSLRYVFTD